MNIKLHSILLFIFLIAGIGFSIRQLCFVPCCRER